MKNCISYYQEVIILDSNEEPELIGQKGIVMGISEEEDIIYGYAIQIPGREHLVCFKPDDIVPTGKKHNRNDFY